jgi:hypothetical protein
MSRVRAFGQLLGPQVLNVAPLDRIGCLVKEGGDSVSRVGSLYIPQRVVSMWKVY